jgi:hypothetical protein
MNFTQNRGYSERVSPEYKLKDLQLLTCTGRFLFLLTGSRCCVHGDRCTGDCEAHKNLAEDSVWLMAEKVWNEGQLLILWTS